MVVSMVSVVFFCIIYDVQIRPLLHLKATIEKISTQDYAFEMDYQINGNQEDWAKELMQGHASGKQVGKNSLVSLSKNNTPMLDIFTGEEDMAVNIKPFAEMYLKKGMGGYFDMAKALLGTSSELYISGEQLEQLGSVLGDKSGENSQLVLPVFNSSQIDADNMQLKITKAPENLDKSYQKKYDFFLIKSKNEEEKARIIIGIPKREFGSAYISGNMDEVTITASMTYTFGEFEALKMPDTTAGDEVLSRLISAIKMIQSFQM